MTTTWIRNADWVVAWDGAAAGHAYLRGADVVFAGDALSFVGHGYRGRADETIDGRRLMVMRGLVDLHAHPNLETAYRGIREEHSVPEMAMTGLFERSGAYWPDQEGMLAWAEAAYCELLLSGVTTLVDISGVYPGWIDLIARSGLRGVVAPTYASARWVDQSTQPAVPAAAMTDGRRALLDRIDADRARSESSGSSRSFTRIEPASAASRRGEEPSSPHTVRFGEKAVHWMRFAIRTPGGHSAYPHVSAERQPDRGPTHPGPRIARGPRAPDAAQGRPRPSPARASAPASREGWAPARPNG